MTTFAVTSVSSIRCHASICFRIGSKFRCIRLTPTEMQSMSENDFERFASTGVNARVQCFQIRISEYSISKRPTYGPLGPTSFNFRAARRAGAIPN